jgi:hypothetical protein
MALAAIGCQEPQEQPGVGQARQADQGHGVGGGDPDPVKALKKAPNPYWSKADDRIVAPIWLGNNNVGSLYTPLWRGGFPGMEDYVYTPPGGDCSGVKGTVRVDWDVNANTVHFLVKAKGLPSNPSVTRTNGVDWWPDAFHPAPQNVTNGKYRLWVIRTATTHPGTFYYDPSNLQLLGSNVDFPNGAPSPVSIQIPMLLLTDSLAFDVGADGYVSHQWTIPYNQVTGEGGTFAHAYGTFAPNNLCEAAPLQPDISQLRPYVSQWQPPSAGVSWASILAGGLGFDIQVEDASPQPPQYAGHLPYIFGGISVAGNVTAIRGGVPNGYSMSIVAAFRNVAPPIEPVIGGNGPGCSSYVFEPHVTAPLYCQGQH